MKPEAFIGQLRPAVSELVEGLEARSIVLAHGAYESGWGVTKAYTHGNNPFNITRLADDPNPVIRAGDLEYGADGKARKITQRFAAYPTLAAALAHYLTFISKKRYRPARDCLATGDLAGFCSALAAGHYFTLPLSQYMVAMSSVHARVQSTLKEMER